MNTQNLCEKLYFHELEQREKIASRLQLPLALILATIGFLGHMLKSVNLEAAGTVANLFWLSFVIASAVLVLATYKFINALWGNTYGVLPHLHGRFRKG